MYEVKVFTSPKQLDCGATCMKMLLDYYGVQVSLDDLIAECNTSIIGCTASDLVRCGNQHGLDMKAYKMTAAQLVKQDRPSIAWWKYNHFCIFAGIDDFGNVIVINPDRGRFKIALATFATMYTGVAVFNGEPAEATEPQTIMDRVSDTEIVADMAYVNSELALALIEMEV